MIAPSIYTLISNITQITDKLSTYQFTSGTDSPAIFTSYEMYDDSARAAIIITEDSGDNAGTRGQKGGEQGAEIRILGNKQTSDQLLRDIATLVWENLDRSALLISGFDSKGVYADLPIRVFDLDGFPGYSIAVRVLLLKS